MGTLNPDVTYIYERNGDNIYAREVGKTERKLIGYTHTADPRTIDGKSLHEHIIEDKLWGEIRRAAPTNPALQKALDRAIMIYRLRRR